MRALIQRVTAASVKVAEQEIGAIGPGLVIFLGVAHGDTTEDVNYLAEKCVRLRIFRDEADKMNCSLLDVGGRALVVPQFTLYGDARKGRRPDFTAAAPSEQAITLYQSFIKGIEQYGVVVATGEFGADMLVEIKNHGPVTLMLESKERGAGR